MLGLSLTAVGEESGYAVYITKYDLDTAKEHAESIATQLRKPSSVLPHKVGDTDVFRVASTYLLKHDAMVLMISGRQSGYPESWYLASDSAITPLLSYEPDPDALPTLETVLSDTQASDSVAPTPVDRPVVEAEDVVAIEPEPAVAPTATEPSVETNPGSGSSRFETNLETFDLDAYKKYLELGEDDLQTTLPSNLPKYEPADRTQDTTKDALKEAREAPSLWQIPNKAERGEIEPPPTKSTDTSSMDTSTVPSRPVVAESVAVSSDESDNLKKKPLAPPSFSIESGEVLRLNTLDQPDVRIDGHLDEAVWLDQPVLDEMRVIWPETLVEPHHATRVRMFTTPRGLYVGAELDQPADTLVERFANRDAELNRDTFTVTLDTSGNGLFGFWFGICLGGSKMDGKVAPERQFTDQWDGAWTGETSAHENGWVAEMFIPWSIVTMPKDNDTRNLAYSVERKVAHLDETHAWPALYWSQPKFMSALQPIEVQNVNPKQSWEFFPYVASATDGVSDVDTSKLGLSYSWKPVADFQLTGTIQPDFGAVESDDVVVNLTAYETYFPEKRLFFLEGSEVFITSPRSNPRRSASANGTGSRAALRTYNPEPTTLLNTRRIGGAPRHISVPDGIEVNGTQLSKPTELIGALKAVGQSAYGRYGVLMAMEDEPVVYGRDEITGERRTVTAPGRDFGVARWLYEENEGQGRRAIGYMGTMASYPDFDAVVHGLDAHFQTSKGSFNADAQLVASDVEDEHGFGGWLDMRFFGKWNLIHNVSVSYLDDTLDVSHLGYLQRNDMRGFRYFTFRVFNENLPDFLRQANIGSFSSIERNSNGDIVRAWAGGQFTMQLHNRTEVGLQYSYRPKMVDDYLTRGNGDFETKAGHFAQVSVGTNSAKKVAFSTQGTLRDGPLGEPSYIYDIGVTYSPLTSVSLDYDLRYIIDNGRLVHIGDGEFEVYQTTDLQHIVGVDYFLTSKQQLRATLQWVGIKGDIDRFLRVSPNDLGLQDRPQPESDFGEIFPITRMTAQVRYRYEIAPLSHFFLVYTRGANPDPDQSYGFSDLWDLSLNETIVDTWVAKLRYRFGS